MLMLMQVEFMPLSIVIVIVIIVGSLLSVCSPFSYEGHCIVQFLSFLGLRMAHVYLYPIYKDVTVQLIHDFEENKSQLAAQEKRRRRNCLLTVFFCQQNLRLHDPRPKDKTFRHVYHSLFLIYCLWTLPAFRGAKMRNLLQLFGPEEEIGGLLR